MGFMGFDNPSARDREVLWADAYIFQVGVLLIDGYLP